MKVTLSDHLGIREVEVLFVDGLVSRGDQWFPGVVIPEPTALAESAAYAINDGGFLACEWDEEDGQPKTSFVVSSVTSQELAHLQMLDAGLPEGATIRTEDGYKFSVVDGEITDGDMSFGSLPELDVEFVLTNDKLKPIAPQQGGLSM